MKISLMILGLMIIIMALFTFGHYGNAINNQIEGNDLNLTFTNKTATYDAINTSTNKLKQSLEDISNKREEGFLSVLAEGLYALPNALIQVPLLIFTIISSAIQDLSVMLLGFAIPLELVGMVIVFCFVWVVFELIKVFAGKDL